MTRIEKLEKALRAAMKLRKSIRQFDDPPEMVMWLVPVEEVRKFDAVIEELKK